MSNIHPTVYRIDLNDDDFIDVQDGKPGGSIKRKSFSEGKRATKSPCNHSNNGDRSEADKQTRKILSAIDGLKSTLERKLSNLEERLTSKLRKEFDKEIKKVKLDLDQGMKTLDEYIQSVENFAKTQPCGDESEPQNKIVFMNLPEEDDEDTKDAVTSIIRDKLNLPDISILCAERKRSYSPKKPGIVIVTCLSLDDKITILKKKMNLKSIPDLQDVYIVPYNTRSEQKQIKTLKNMVEHIRRNSYQMRPRDDSRRRYSSDDDGADGDRRDTRRRSSRRNRSRSRSNHRYN